MAVGMMPAKRRAWVNGETFPEKENMRFGGFMRTLKYAVQSLCEKRR